ncbi:hypothetical protein PtrCC142_003533 [Pyrenophora tritici-repentis]|uniref:Pentatricopeptide repeat protein n=1 Tax=Pyrenophora tritici-repentis TaxID=45151 RepID=A0A922NNS0_9PLEO|nr:hypothetical protein Ptr86124_000661 [Pyrenophora tritici-repentis]KAI1583589.1 hypothetical protein PtrEW7m1_003241 [Pyrenophora tritici-repentis]KAI1604298.1 hypothetical protein PtrCC142_003533 [Pyrenophora tritici-repentis]KAI1687512.1 hypothetical protein KJE20_00689 [Pyrenophora tritici-repentis]
MLRSSALVRRGGRTKLRGTWPLGAPTSTFVYTAIFAVGLSVDAKSKAIRNKQWEEAFARLNNARDNCVPAKKPEEVNGGYNPDIRQGLSFEDLPEDFDWGAFERIVGMELVDDQVLQTQEVQSQLRDYATMDWEDLRYDSRFPGIPPLEWPANTGPDLILYNLPPQSLWAPDTQRLNAIRRRHTWKKLAIQELATCFLIHELLYLAKVSRHAKSARSELEKLAPQILEVSSQTEDQYKEARFEILQALRVVSNTPVDSSPEKIADARKYAGHRAIPHYYQDADGDFYAITKQMNDGLKTLLRDVPRGNAKEESIMIAKICHNLLISSASPDLQTFNTLLVGFRHWRRRELIDRVIAAFYVNKIRPNEITCREILNHYAHVVRPESFSRFVARMRGVGETLMLANPNISVNEASQDRLVRANNEKIYQKVYPTPMVFDALIRGVMRFAGFERALDIYYEMKADGWGLEVQSLTRLLKDCIRRVDWEGGLYVWEEINSMGSRAKYRDMADAYTHMLSLCSISNKTVAFNQILSDIGRRGFDVKSIIDAATELTRVQENKKVYLAPAWAADNMLIAVSDYIHDAKPDEPAVVSELPEDPDTMFSQHHPDPIDDIENSTSDHVKDNKDAWASWLEHELGGKPKDPKP